ncbi:MAG: MerR family DNA-binding transcriptional regulator [Chloroflexi bacterium]|nr:MAG: MerR family DNA-binding transcriptional regulator [Chloroflexota bacterium]
MKNSFIRSQVANRTGFTKRTLRYYEEVGLLLLAIIFLSNRAVKPLA